MIKLEPIVADGSELIIYAPHITEICVAHGRVIAELGYHCRDYFCRQWDRFQSYPWGVAIAHSTHVRPAWRGQKMASSACRIRVTLATGIPEETCRQINLSYRDPDSIRLGRDFADREEEGVLLVPKAGEMLYQLRPTRQLGRNPRKGGGGGGGTRQGVRRRPRPARVESGKSREKRFRSLGQSDQDTPE